LYNILSAEWLSDLCRSVPRTGYREVIGRSAAKPYRMHCRQLLPRGKKHPDNLEELPASWRALRSVLLDSRYRAAMQALIGVDLTPCEIEATLWIYEQDCFLDPHTDKEEKMATHLLYLTLGWKPEWGGGLRILRSPDRDDHVIDIAPLPERSVVLVRSNNSWHSVERIAPSCRQQRRSLQVTFWSA
jgi:SM-20-related protein